MREFMAKMIIAAAFLLFAAAFMLNGEVAAAALVEFFRKLADEAGMKLTEE